MPFILEEKTDQASNATYTSLLKSKILSRLYTSLTIYNAHASHQLKYKILVTNDSDGVDGWAEDKAEATLAGLTGVKYNITGPFVWVDVQIMSNGSGESPHASAWLHAVGL